MLFRITSLENNFPADELLLNYIFHPKIVMRLNTQSLNIHLQLSRPLWNPCEKLSEKKTISVKRWKGWNLNARAAPVQHHPPQSKHKPPQNDHCSFVYHQRRVDKGRSFVCLLNVLVWAENSGAVQSSFFVFLHPCPISTPPSLTTSSSP